MSAASLVPQILQDRGEEHVMSSNAPAFDDIQDIAGVYDEADRATHDRKSKYPKQGLYDCRDFACVVGTLDRSHEQGVDEIHK